MQHRFLHQGGQNRKKLLVSVWPCEEPIQDLRRKLVSFPLDTDLVGLNLAIPDERSSKTVLVTIEEDQVR